MMNQFAPDQLRTWPPGTVAAIATCTLKAGDDPADDARAPAPGAWSSPIRRRLAPARAEVA